MIHPSFKSIAFVLKNESLFYGGRANIVFEQGFPCFNQNQLFHTKQMSYAPNDYSFPTVDGFLIPFFDSSPSSGLSVSINCWWFLYIFFVTLPLQLLSLIMSAFGSQHDILEPDLDDYLEISTFKTGIPVWTFSSILSSPRQRKSSIGASIDSRLCWNSE